jgi:Holliday junction resolvasome RuvABC ATP-dependent DNA helicase subunit
LTTIVERSAAILKCSFLRAAIEIAGRSRGTPVQNALPDVLEILLKIKVMVLLI